MQIQKKKPRQKQKAKANVKGEELLFLVWRWRDASLSFGWIDERLRGGHGQGTSECNDGVVGWICGGAAAEFGESTGRARAGIVCVVFSDADVSGDARSGRRHDGCG